MKEEYKRLLDDCFIRFINMPYTIGGYVAPNEDGTFNIYINVNLSRKKQQAALLHELRHIMLDHLWKDESVEVEEKEADSLS